VHTKKSVIVRRFILTFLNAIQKVDYGNKTSSGA